MSQVTPVRRRQPVLVAAVLICAACTLSHWTDRNLGGHGSDVPSLGLLTLVALIAIYARIQERKR